LEETLRRGFSSQSQIPTASYRLGVDIEERFGEVLSGRKIFLELTVARES
jgi:hypothetical protein